MAALTGDRKTQHVTTEDIALPAAASVTVYFGALVSMDTSGNARPGRTSTDDVCLGWNAHGRVDNASGSAGDKSVEISKFPAKFANSAAADEISASDIGSTCYVVDDQTVALTDGTSTRIAAGTILDVHSDGVVVKFA